MASTGEDNIRKSNLTVNVQEGRNLLSVYKKLEDVITDKQATFDDKIAAVLNVWNQIKDLLGTNQYKYIQRVTDWAQTHTLNLVLHGDWASQQQTTKDELLNLIIYIDCKLTAYKKSSCRRAKKVIEVVRDPWGDKTLCKILNDPEKCTKEEELEYFASEHGFLVAMRLKKLCDSHCEDLALRFANACLRCLRMPESQHFHVVTTNDQKKYILDIYIALLHKYKRIHDIIYELKHLSLEDGLQLVYRFTNKRIELSRVWRHCSRIAELAAQFFMTAAMTKPFNEVESFLTDLLNAWVVLSEKLEGIETIPTVMRRIIQTADSAAHIYICCEILNKKFGKKIKSFTIEMYIRALTTDMNEMEKQKSQCETEKVNETSKRLSEGFLSLADLLQDHIGVSRECVLTSFSLNPTRVCMDRIEKLAIACGKAPDPSKSSENLNPEYVSNEIHDSGYYNNADKSAYSLNSNNNRIHIEDKVPLIDTGQNTQSSNKISSWNIETSKTKDNEQHKERTLDALILIKGDAVTGSKNYDVLSAPNQVLDAEALGLSAQLCDDLAVVLSSPRYQLLSWVLDWNELKTTCDKYLSNAEGTRCVVKELKYLNIDYNQFKDWPRDNSLQFNNGIEKGYEQWADDNSNVDSMSNYRLMYGNDSDSNSSVIRSRRGRRRTKRRIYSSESEYDSAERKVDSQGSSDVDTASQDADSLGSDGLQQESASKKSKRSSSVLPRFAMLMNSRRTSVPQSTFNKNNMISIFARLDETAKQQQQQQQQHHHHPVNISKPSYGNPPIQNFIFPEKRSSDPQVLKNLRMYRNKKAQDNSKNLKNENNNSEDISEDKVSKLKNLPHMNPRVLLDRHDFNTYPNNSSFKKSLKHELGDLVKNTDLESCENKPINLDCYNKVNMNPRVLLNRCEEIQKYYNSTNVMDNIKERRKRKLDILADIPGLNSLEMIRPAVIQPTIQVVQLSSNQINNQQMRTVKTQASSSNVTNITSSITSTPVTAHIQRIGQPRSHETPKVSHISEGNETNNIIVTNSNSTTNTNIMNCNTDSQTSASQTTIVSSTIAQKFIDKTTTTTTSPKTTLQSSQSTPTLVNILSQQIIRPAQSNTSTTRSSTLINILSQQIIRPPLSSQSVPIVCVTTSGLQNNLLSNTSMTTTVTQAQSSLKLVTTNSSQQQLLQQLFNSQSKNNNQLLKNVNLVTGITNSQSVEASRLVQFLYKRDGKMIQLTPYPPNSNITLQTIDSSKLIKSTCSTITTSKQVTTESVSVAPSSSPISVRSGYEENYAKFIQTSNKTKNSSKENSTENNELANSLPKFQQAFGKTVYQNNTVDSVSTISEPNITNTNSVNLQSVTVTNSNQVNVTTVTSSAATINSHLPNIQLANTSLIGKSNATTTVTAAVTSIPLVSTNKSTVPPLGVQAIQSGVIYTRQVPVSLALSANASVTQSTIGRNPVFRFTSATSEQLNLVKDTVIRSKMSALLAAALQSNTSSRSAATTTLSGMTTSTTVSSPSNTDCTIVFSQNQQEIATEPEVCEVDSSSNDSCSTTTNTSTTPTLVSPMRIAVPIMQHTPGANGVQGTRIVRPLLQIPGTMIRGVRQQVVLTSSQPAPLTNATIRPQIQSTPIGESLISHNNMEPQVSSTTLEQLREFDLVLEQVKERSTVQPTIGQTIARTQVQTVEKTTTTTTQSSSSSSSSSSSTEIQDVLPSINVTYMNQNQLTQKVSASVVVVTSYCNIQPAASPALSITSQSSSSPCVTPAPSSSGSIGKTIPKATAKNPKSKNIKTTTTHTSKSSPVPKPQQKPQEDEQTTQRIFDILAEYAEQLRNSPDLNNKPAPRRRSNPPTNPSQNSKRKKNSGSKKPITGHCNSLTSDLSPGTDDPRTVGSEDSSCGVVQISVQDSPSQGASNTDDHQSTQGSTDFSTIRNQQTESSDATTEAIENPLTTTSRQFIFTDSNTNQSRNVIIADSTVNEALGKISNTAAVIVPANYIAVVSGNSKILATVPARSGSNMLLFQSFVNQARKPITGQTNVKSVKYSTLQPIQGISSQTLSGVSAQPPVVLPTNIDTVTLAQTVSLKNPNKTNLSNDNSENVPVTNELLLNIENSSNLSTVTSQSKTNSNDNKLEESSEKNSSSASSQVVNCDPKIKTVGSELDNSIKKVLPLSQKIISSERNETKENSEENVTTVSQKNMSYSINFVTKSSPPVSVIEKNSNLQESTSSTKVNTSCLPELEKSENAVVRSIEQPDAKDIDIDTSNSNNIEFTQIENEDRFAKAFTDEKKAQSNKNGPMLGQTESRVNRGIIITDPNKKSVHEKASSTTMAAPFPKPKKLQAIQRTEKELQQVQQRKQAALERELHLQKSLSEECEDLGVDEPSTSDLFPEADLLFDSNNSPSFDQLTQEVDKKFTAGNFQMESSCNNADENFKKSSMAKKENNVCPNESHRSNDALNKNKSENTVISDNTNSFSPEDIPNASEEPDKPHPSSEAVSQVESTNETEKEPAINLFSDEDDTSLLFENMDYPAGEDDFEFESQSKIREENTLKDGITLQSNTSNYSSYDDHTLLSSCANMMEVCSPIHYDVNSKSPPPLHKYKYKYCNRKKKAIMQLDSSTSKPSEKTENSWHPNSEAAEIISSSEDSSDSEITDRAKSSASESVSSNDRKRESPNWDDDEDEHDDDDDDDSNNTIYKSIYNTNKILKLSVSGKLVEKITCANRQTSSGKIIKKCTLDSSVVSTTPPSPLSPTADGDLESFNIGRSTRRTTQRLKKNCPCCTTSSDTPKKRHPGTNIKKLPTKGHITKKR